MNISTWRNFRIDKLFTASNTGSILARDVEKGSGSTPFVTASGLNNGVAGYIDATKYVLIKGNCILVGGKTFTLTYQKEDFVSNDSHNFEMHLKDIEGNEYIYLFLITVICSAFAQRYSWGDAVTKEKILGELLPLPSTIEGIPNWEHMEQFMRVTHIATRTQLNHIQCRKVL